MLKYVRAEHPIESGVRKWNRPPVVVDHRKPRATSALSRWNVDRCNVEACISQHSRLKTIAPTKLQNFTPVREEPTDLHYLAFAQCFVQITLRGQLGHVK